MPSLQRKQIAKPQRELWNEQILEAAKIKNIALSESRVESI
jgi:hypothetical protein